MKTTKNPKILITGATGNIGLKLCNRLTAQGVPFRAMVRSVESAAQLALAPDSEIKVPDFNVDKSIAEALRGIEYAFLLTNSSEHAEHFQTSFIHMAKRAGVLHIVKLSQWDASKDSPGQVFTISCSS